MNREKIESNTESNERDIGRELGDSYYSHDPHYANVLHRGHCIFYLLGQLVNKSPCF